jgi:membrane protein DedA with SNARE-associated domain/rhodanese-related sulfurtransferase
MADLFQFLLKYGYIVVFGGALAEQIGLPLPAATLLIGMGALTRTGDFSFPAVVATAAFASLLADLVWYALGRHHGRFVLRLICRIALEPDYCVRRTEDAFERLGLWAVVPAKFIPGFNAATIPLAGMMKIPLFRFLCFDIPGVTLWSTAYTLIGYAFSQEIERSLLYLSRLGTSLFTLIAIAIVGYVIYKIEQRRRFFKTLAGARITPEELKAKMDAHEKILIFDLRNRLDCNTDPVRIPGAFHVLPEHVEFQPQDIGLGQEIALYCTCPNEATSARTALRLQRMGLRKARPLLGGLDAWRQLNFPVEHMDE